MKRAIVFVMVFACLLMLINFSSAITIDLHPSYLSSQTAISRLQGNILEPILPSQIEFKRQNVRVPFDYDAKKIGDFNYIWFNTPVVANDTNYTLIIHNITTTISGSAEKIDLYQNFTVQSTLSDYYIKPGFVISKDDFDIQAFLNKDVSQDISLIYGGTKSYTLQPGQNDIHFKVNNADSYGVNFIGVGEYQVPAYLTSSQLTSKKTNFIEINPGFIESKRLTRDNNVFYQIQVRNSGINTVNNVYFQYDPALFTITPADNQSIAPNQEITYQINLSTATRNNISDILYLQSSDNNISLSFPVRLDFVDNISYLNTSGMNISDNQTASYSCAELIGQICSSGQTCTAQSVVSQDGICCTGQCSDVANPGSGGSTSWIGYLIAAIVIVGGLILYLKYKKVKPDKNPLQKKIVESDKLTRPSP